MDKREGMLNDDEFNQALMDYVEIAQATFQVITQFQENSGDTEVPKAPTLEYREATRRFRQAMNHLISIIQKSGQLGKPQQSQWPSGVYLDLYNTALQDMWMYVTTHIHKYEPTRGRVMAWINRILHFRFIDAVRRRMRNNQYQESYHLSLDALDNPDSLIYQVNEDPPPYDLGRVCQIVMAKAQYQQDHLKNCPEASFAAIFMQRIQGLTYAEIAEALEQKPTSIATFYSRRVKKYADEIRRIYDE